MSSYMCDTIWRTILMCTQKLSQRELSSWINTCTEKVPQSENKYIQTFIIVSHSGPKLRTAFKVTDLQSEANDLEPKVKVSWLQGSSRLWPWGRHHWQVMQPSVKQQTYQETRYLNVTLPYTVFHITYFSSTLARWRHCCGLRQVHHRSILKPLLHLTPLQMGFP